MCEFFDFFCWINTLWNLMYEFLYSLTKPIWDFINSILNVIIAVVNAFIMIITSIWGLVSSVYTFIGNTFGIIFGAEITNIVFTLISIIVGLRIYFFIRGSKA